MPQKKMKVWKVVEMKLPIVCLIQMEEIKALVFPQPNSASS